MHDLIVSGGIVVTEDGASPLEIAIQGERIAEVAPRIDAPSRKRIDAAGLCILPGLIDPHVHLGLPMKGTLSSDGVESGTRAGLFGGVTSIVDFTLQDPGQSLPDSLRQRRAAFEGRAYSDYSFHVNVTSFGPHAGRGTFAERLPGELAEVARLGSASLKVFTCYSGEGIGIDPHSLSILLRQARDAGLLVLVHAEHDGQLKTNLETLLASGRRAPADYPHSRPPEAEARAIREVIAEARNAEAAVYFVHVSTQGGTEAIRAGRLEARTPIYFETCPQYLILDESAYGGPDAPQFMVAPPLRRPADRAALLDALRDGLVDVVATDHCPFRREQKSRPGAPFPEIPNGLPGIETRLALLYTLGVVAGRITLEKLVGLTSTQPARIFGLYPEKGCIRPGSDADLVLFDPQAEWEVTPAALHMNTDFSPYSGMRVNGRVRQVLLRGEVALEGDRILGGARGRYLSRELR